MTDPQSERQLKVLLYSDDRTVRREVRLALGTRVAPDLPPLDIFDVATEPAVIKALDNGHYDLVILDGEAVPSGGMGIAYRMKDEYADCPPVLLLVARVADAWLATWSKAEAIATHPIDPVRLPSQVAEVLRAHVAEPAK
jgi:DNA-binding response OmpR family regulator